jgi:hypothetical protein
MNEKIYQWVKYGVKMLVAVALFCYLLWSFEQNRIEDFTEKVVEPYLEIPVWLARVLTLTVTILIGIKAFLVCKYKQRFRWPYVLPIVAALTIIYVRYRFYPHVFVFMTEIIWDVEVSYVGIVLVAYYILLLIASIVEFRLCRQRKRESIRSADVAYLDDNPADSKEADALKYFVRAGKIAEEIQTLPLEHAWSIGIVGAWGSGKTSFINFITDQLPEKDYCIITFNPRMAASVSRIQEQALTTLEEHLRLYNADLFALIHRYMKAMKIADTNRWVQFVITMFRGPEDGEELKRRVDEILRKLPIRVVFVFEDFDRLGRDEIIEVLKLIDGNAKFSNIIYMAAYDYAYVDKLFMNDGKYSHYISKYFHIEHHVPFRPSDYIRDYIINDLMQKPLRISEEGYAQAPDNIITDRWDVIQPYLQTLRDAKRYLNLLRSDYSQVEAEVDLEDFMLITLLKYSNIEMYEELFFNPNKYFSKGARVTYVEHEGEDNLILKILFPQASEQSRRPRRIRDKDAFLTYFVAEIYSLPMAKMTEVLRQDISNSQPQIREWIDTGKIGDFVQFLYFNYKWFIPSDAELYNYADISLMLLHEANSKIQLPDMRTMFTNEMWSGMSTLYKSKSKKEGYKRHLLVKLKETEWNKGDMHLITRLVSALTGTEAKDYIVTLAEITEICNLQLKRVAERYLNKPNEETFAFGMLILATCVESEAKEGVRLRADSCVIMRNMIDREPKYYIRDYVMMSNPKSSAGTHEVYCEEYWRQIFGGIDEMDSFWNRKDYDKYKNIGRDRNFWILYRTNEYQPFKVSIESNATDAENYDFEEEIRKLKQLQSYRMSFERILLGTSQLRKDRRLQLDALRDVVQDVKLDNREKGRLLDDIHRQRVVLMPKATIEKI